MKRVLTIAGSDSTGGAGIQADLKTFQEYGVYGFASLTSIVTMDPQHNWTHEVTELPEALLEKQLVSVFSGQTITALKTGMMGNERNIQLASKWIEKENVGIVVVDPVIACKGTAEIIQPESVVGLRKYLLPQATIVTPNLIEAGILAGIGAIQDIEEMKEAARIIAEFGVKTVVVKDGHRLATANATDVLFDGKEFYLLENEMYQTKNNHGAGCTFSAANTAGLAKGYSILAAVSLAKRFVAAAIQQGCTFNSYLGHVWHGAYYHAQTRTK